MIRYLKNQTERTRQSFAANVAIECEEACRGSGPYVTQVPRPGSRLDLVKITNDAQTPRPGRPDDKPGIAYPNFFVAEAEETISDNFNTIVREAASKLDLLG